MGNDSFNIFIIIHLRWSWFAWCTLLSNPATYTVSSNPVTYIVLSNPATYTVLSNPATYIILLLIVYCIVKSCYLKIVLSNHATYKWLTEL